MSKPADHDYLWDRSGEPDPDAARLEELLAPLAHRAPLDEVRMRRRSRTPWLIASVVAAAAAAAVVWWVLPRDGVSPRAYACSERAHGFAFAARGGPVACGGSAVPAGVLPVGGVLDTGAHQATLEIADIGSAELGPSTRVRLDATSASRHQLFLERGRMHATVIAPPRIFAVGTRSADVIDLGCEYTLEIDERGAGSIHVLSGLVELETGTGITVQVPAGARARLLPGRRASLPLRDDATAELDAAVRDYEHGVHGAIDRILDAATPADLITITNLAERATPDQNPRVVDRMRVLEVMARFQ